MIISGSQTVAAPRDALWAVLSDPAIFAVFEVAVDGDGNVFASIINASFGFSIIEFPGGAMPGTILNVTGFSIAGGLAFDDASNLLVADFGGSPGDVAIYAPPYTGAPTRILPSSPMSTMPERSDQRPARQARISGMASRIPEAKTTMKASNHSMPTARQMGGCVVRRASRVATGRRNMCSSAPANSTTRPWMTTIMSRLIFGLSKASSAPPW